MLFDFVICFYLFYDLGLFLYVYISYNFLTENIYISYNFIYKNIK